MPFYADLSSHSRLSNCLFNVGLANLLPHMNMEADVSFRGAEPAVNAGPGCAVTEPWLLC